MIDALPLLLGPEGYQISRSVRLRRQASAYFARTPSVTGSRTTFTISMWLKRSDLTAESFLLNAQLTGTAYFRIKFSLQTPVTDILQVTAGTAAVLDLQTTQLFRDPSGWYHFVFVADMNNASASDRFKIYVNGSRITSFTTATYPAAGTSLGAWNLATYQNVLFASSVPATFFGGYAADVVNVDGLALDASYFGETNPVTGVWQPKKYTGTYGTNGFYLNFSDNSAATAAAIGKDYSGNGNNWTPNNISVTAGATYDSMLDVPTPWADGGNGRGNYAVLNPLSVVSPTTLSDGNLGVVTGTTGGGGAFSTIAMPTSGKFYFEFVATAVSATLSDNARIGVATASVGNYVIYKSDGNKVVDGTTSAYGSSFALNDVIGCAIDVDSGTVTFYKNNVSQGAITYSTSNGNYFAYTQDGSGTVSVTANINFGQRPFSYTPPSGFKALNTLNLPTPTILKGNQYFDATTYTGNGSTQSIVNAGGMQPDLVWIKNRGAVASNSLVDAVRGANAYLYSDLTNAEGSGESFSSFNSNGFSLSGTNARQNANANTYVGWQLKEGATQGFDIVTFTIPASGTFSYAHNLGVPPAMVIFKPRNVSANWNVWHKSMGVNDYILLNSTAAKGTDANRFAGAPTSTQVNCGTSFNGGGSTQDGWSLVFAEVAGFSKFGSYTGNGNADGPFVFCGFRPRFLMLKRSDNIGDWVMIDSERSQSNTVSAILLGNSSNAETSTAIIDFVSNGFKLRALNNNASGGIYVFAAFAENPFKYSLAR